MGHLRVKIYSQQRPTLVEASTSMLKQTLMNTCAQETKQEHLEQLALMISMQGSGATQSPVASMTCERASRGIGSSHVPVPLGSQGMNGSIDELFCHRFEQGLAKFVGTRRLTRPYLFKNFVEETDEFAGPHRQRAPA